MMKRMAILVAAGSIFAAHAQKTCSPADMQRAQKAVDLVLTWQQLNKAWKDWRQCDTGEVADTFTDAMMRMMVDWKNVDVLGETMKDPEYKAFIEAHLSSPAAKDDLPMIRSRATQSCPKGQDAVCKQLAAITEVAKPLDLAPMAPIPAISDPNKK
jgi:hypothetical protein